MTIAANKGSGYKACFIPCNNERIINGLCECANQRPDDIWIVTRNEDVTEDMYNLPPKVEYIKPRYFMFVYSWYTVKGSSGKGSICISSSVGNIPSQDYVKNIAKDQAITYTDEDPSDVSVVVENIVEFKSEQDYNQWNSKDNEQT